MIPRTVSLDALRIFEVAARHLSFTKAAAELSLTQGAVSQRIKALEARLGKQLFRRLTRVLELTPEGQYLQTALQEGFARIASGLDGIRSNMTRRPLRLTVSLSLATRWLLPRLSRLTDASPSISVTADDRLVEVGLEADAALRFGSGRYRGLESRRLADEAVFPVCSPAFLERYPAAIDFGIAARRKRWVSLTRLVDSVAEWDRSGCGWRSWGEAVGVSWSDNDPMMSLSHAHLALQAALEGLGVALGRRTLVADDLKAGRLRRVGEAFSPLPARFAYYFVTRGEPGAEERALASWLEGQLAATARDAPTGLS